MHAIGLVGVETIKRLFRRDDSLSVYKAVVTPECITLNSTTIAEDIFEAPLAIKVSLAPAVQRFQPPKEMAVDASKKPSLL